MDTNFNRFVKTHFNNLIDLKFLATRHPHFKEVKNKGLTTIMKKCGLQVKMGHHAGRDALMAMELSTYCTWLVPDCLNYKNKLWSLCEATKK